MPSTGKANRIAKTSTGTLKPKQTRKPKEKQIKNKTMDDIVIDDRSLDGFSDDESKVEIPKVEEPKVEEPKVEEPVKEEIKIPLPELKELTIDSTPIISEPVKEESKVEEPKVDESKPVEETSKEVTKEKKQRKPKGKRVLKDKKIITNEAGEKTYEYIYEIVDGEGKVVGTQTVSNNKKLSGIKKYSTEMDDEIAKSMEEWIKKNNIQTGNLYKRTNLDKHLKDINEYIIEHNDVKLTQKQIRDIFKTMG